MQYGKVISYWHCRLAAMNEVVRCDCEDHLVADSDRDSGMHSNALATAKSFTEECYYHKDQVTGHSTMTVYISNQYPPFIQSFPEETPLTIFQPPRA